MNLKWISESTEWYFFKFWCGSKSLNFPLRIPNAIIDFKYDILFYYPVVKFIRSFERFSHSKLNPFASIHTLKNINFFAHHTSLICTLCYHQSFCFTVLSWSLFQPVFQKPSENLMAFVFFTGWHLEIVMKGARVSATKQKKT